MTALHGLAGWSLWLVPWPLELVIAAAGLLLLSAVLSWRLADKPGVVQIHYDGQQWTLQDCRRQIRSGRLLKTTWISRWLVLLHFRMANGRFQAVPVWRDSVSEEQFRQLRVILRWQVKWAS